MIDIPEGFKITKLPPGKAYGADDLRKWSDNRATGRSGVAPDRTRNVVYECRACKKTTPAIVSRYMQKKEARKLRCRH